MGGVVNILSNRPSDVPPGFYATVEGGGGNQSQAIGQLESSARFGSSEAFLTSTHNPPRAGSTRRPSISIHNNSSQSDQFFRFITQLTPRSTLAFDYSNQLAQFQIPINTDPNNPFDPIITPPGTDDVQREYDRFSNLNFTVTSLDGNGIVQVIPWWRSTRINYDGDLLNDVLGVTPDFSADAVCRSAAHRSTLGSGSGQLHNVGLLSNTYASYSGVRRRISARYRKIMRGRSASTSTARTSSRARRSRATTQRAAGRRRGPTSSRTISRAAESGQAGSQIGIYGQDNWKLSN